MGCASSKGDLVLNNEGLACVPQRLKKKTRAASPKLIVAQTAITPIEVNLIPNALEAAMNAEVSRNANSKAKSEKRIGLFIVAPTANLTSGLTGGCPQGMASRSSSAVENPSV